jgi:hypothetical protein
MGRERIGRRLHSEVYDTFADSVLRIALIVACVLS